MTYADTFLSACGMRNQLPPYSEPKGECRKSADESTKIRYDLLPFEPLEDIARVLAFGASKYGENNWKRGARWGRYFAALLRHLTAWWRGQDLDPETNLPHLAHAGCCLLFLMSYQQNKWGQDDRFPPPDNQPFTKSDGIERTTT